MGKVRERAGGKLNILFLTLSKMEDINDRGIYTDLVRELSCRDINVYIVSPNQRRENLPTELLKLGNINILKVKTGNITATKSFIEKGLSTIMIEDLYLNAIKKHFNNIKSDMMMYSTPPISFNKIKKYLRINIIVRLLESKGYISPKCGRHWGNEKRKFAVEIF